MNMEQSRTGGWWDGQAIRSPIAQIDMFLVLARWLVILAIGVMSLLTGFQGTTLLPPGVALAAIVAYNLPVSFYAWRRQPLGNGRVGRLLFGDLVQSTLAVALTGGYRSFYFVLFLLTMTEMALAWPWKLALPLALGSAALQVGAMVFYRAQLWEQFAMYMVVGKFIISLIVGGLAILSSELVRRADAARRQASRAAERAAALNAVFMHLGESILDLERTLAVILDSTSALPGVVFSLVLLPEPGGDSWRIAASNTAWHPTGELVTGLAWDDQSDQSLFSAGAASSHPLPPFVSGDEIERLTGTRLCSPCGKVLGVLVVGWQTGRALSGDEQTFLQSLALEAGLALRNARLYAQEQEHVARLQHFEDLQSTFFSAIGHELKTPLTVLKTLVPSLHQWTTLPAETRAEIGTTIEQNLNRLETLVTDFLESARLEAGAITLHPHAVNLPQFTGQVLDELGPLFSRKNQRPALQAGPDIPQIQADGRRLRQILSGLLSNAAKFAPAESVIAVQLSRVDAGVQVCVSDTGPGVPLQEQERIFDKFYTAASNQALVGTGLGLYICRELVHLHGGRIWVADRPGGGSNFCFTLPLAQEERDA